jgi:hypothetical protein
MNDQHAGQFFVSVRGTNVVSTYVAVALWRGHSCKFRVESPERSSQCTAPKFAMVRGLSDSILQVNGAYGKLGLGLVRGVGLGVGKSSFICMQADRPTIASTRDRSTFLAVDRM